MRVVHNLRQLGTALPASVVTIGNFDGFHVAHQKLLRRVVEHARRTGAVAVALTFDPHPIKVLAPEHAPKLLTPLAAKTRLIEALGLDLLVVISFTREVAHLSPLEFVRSILRGPLRASSVHVGQKFRFGYRQSGDIEVLRALARHEGFRLEVLPTLEVRGEQVSSTRIRELLSLGRVNLAARLLGRKFSSTGPIVAGMGVGHKHTVPTLNLAPVEEQLPRVGVYVTRSRVSENTFESVTNIGRKPTFGDHELTVETHLLNFSGEIQASTMEVEFLYRLRDEIRFQNPAILKVQIQEDARRALKFFRLFKIFHERHVHRLTPTQRVEM